MLSPSTLSRSFASNCAQCAPSGNDKEARALIATIKTAYLNLPFKGRPLVLPGGLVVVADMWGVRPGVRQIELTTTNPRR